MADTWYAWTQINNGGSDVKDDKRQGTVTVIPIGAEVSKSDFSSDEEWAALVAGGSVRREAYPDLDLNTANPESPIDYLRRKAREAGELLDSTVTSMGVAVTPIPTKQPVPAAEET